MWDVRLIYIQPLPILTKKQINRFWSKIKQCGPDECWPFTYHLTEDGYGKVSFGQDMYTASRIAYLLKTGEDPGDRLVCHTCDNPTCCNPKHLILGTHQYNTKDAVAKGRHSSLTCGEKHGSSKLTEEDVLKIRSSILPVTELAKIYNIHWSTIYQVKTKKSWRHV